MQFHELMLHCGMLLRSPERTWAMFVSGMNVALRIAPKDFGERIEMAVCTSKNEWCTARGAAEVLAQVLRMSVFNMKR